VQTTDARPVVGLTTDEAFAQLRADGPNELPRQRPPSALRRFVGQLVHFFALTLWAACALALVGGLPQLAVAISVVVVLNAVFAFLQESRANRAAEHLRALLPNTVTVRRDGRPTRIDASEVVVGDLVLLDAGDRVPADAMVAVTDMLTVDTSLLTGESEAALTSSGDALFAGTFVVEGYAEATVTATGAKTRSPPSASSPPLLLPPTAL
jgi:magnesium-transporting ATPase (P-type)